MVGFSPIKYIGSTSKIISIWGFVVVKGAPPVSSFPFGTVAFGVIANTDVWCCVLVTVTILVRGPSHV